MNTEQIRRIDYCSFCNASQEQAWLIAGPGRTGTPERKLICEQCVARAKALLAAPPTGMEPTSGKASTARMEKITEAKRICSFCHKRRAKVRHLLGGPGDAAICDECIRLCDEINVETSGQC